MNIMLQSFDKLPDMFFLGVLALKSLMKVYIRQSI